MLQELKNIDWIHISEEDKVEKMGNSIKKKENILKNELCHP